MRTIDAEQYATLVGDRIEDDLEVRLLITFNALAERFGFERISAGEREEEFEIAYYEGGYAAEIRDLAIRFFEDAGMDIRPDDKEW